MAPGLPSPRANILNVVGVISASLAKVGAKNMPSRLKKAGTKCSSERSAAWIPCQFDTVQCGFPRLELGVYVKIGM
jgi:hypothetical protein